MVGNVLLETQVNLTGIVFVAPMGPQPKQHHLSNSVSDVQCVTQCFDVLFLPDTAAVPLSVEEEREQR